MPDNQKKKNSTIQLGHFEVISDVDATQFEVFLSYTGKQFDHCGIQIRATGGIGKEAIHRVIQISNSSDSDIGRVEVMGIKALVASISSDPSQRTYGEYFTIKTRNGESLASAFASLSEHYQVSAIVETYQCD